MSLSTVHAELRAAIRTLMLTLVAATTGTLTNVSASGSTYTRASGSFLTDGFSAGDEIMAAGFGQAGNNGRALITSVSALTMTVDKALTTESAGSNVSLVAGLWQGRAWEGVSYAPTRGQPFLRESVRPVSSEVRGIGANGLIAHVVAGVFTLNYPAGRGTVALERMAGAIMTIMKPGTALNYGSSSAVITETGRSPLYQEPDWLACPVTITAVGYTDS